MLDRSFHWLSAALVATAFSSCCGAYKGAIDTEAGALGRRPRATYDALPTPEEKKETILADTAFICFNDSEQGKTSKEKPTAACKCTNGAPADWETNCADWLASLPH